MLFNGCLSDKCTYAAKHEAKYEQYRNGFVIYRAKKIVTVLCGIAAVYELLPVGIGSYYNRKIIGTYPEAENTVAQDSLFKALIIT